MDQESIGARIGPMQVDAWKREARRAGRWLARADRGSRRWNATAREHAVYSDMCREEARKCRLLARGYLIDLMLIRGRK